MDSPPVVTSSPKVNLLSDKVLLKHYCHVSPRQLRQRHWQQQRQRRRHNDRDLLSFHKLLLLVVGLLFRFSYVVCAKVQPTTAFLVSSSLCNMKKIMTYQQRTISTNNIHSLGDKYYREPVVSYRWECNGNTELFRRPSLIAAMAKVSSLEDHAKETSFVQQRRDALTNISQLGFVGALGSIVLSSTSLAPEKAYAADDEAILMDARKQIEIARDQLLGVPEYLEKQQWDSVRALLLKPPLSECWNKRQPVLMQYAEALGNIPDGDELAALEYKEDAASHLRFLDMAVYNNVFNPIATEGESGATKELIRSYYEDPKNEYKASLQALNELLNLSK